MNAPFLKLFTPAVRLLPAALLAALALAACRASPAAPTSFPPAPPVAAAPTTAPQSYSDPFDYCAALGTIDAPDGRYSGEKLPEALVQGYLKAAGIPDNPDFAGQTRASTTWRCMGGKVMVCSYGANLPCDAKANTSKDPSPEMSDFCQANPEVDFIPAYVTGRETIYSWRCSQGAPRLLEQIAHADGSGFLQEIWYAVEPIP